MGTITLPKLYKLSSVGKIQEWQICYSPDPEGGRYTITHGQRGGKLQSTTTYISEGKNLGKANETTPFQQAEAEARALWIKQRDRKGYLECIPAEQTFRPMLAQPYDKHGSKIVFPAYIQPKIDGCRCITYYDVIEKKVVYMSRQLKRFNTLGHLDAALEDVLKGGTVLDGELYNHALKDNFQKIVSLIRRDTPVADSSLIQYHVYDVVSDDDYKARKDIFSSLLTGKDNVFPVKTIEISTAEEVEKYHNQFVSQGYEGAIIRNMAGGYEVDKRSYNLQKYKHFDTDEFEIVGAMENKGKQAGQCSIECKTKDGKRFYVKPKGMDFQREEYWDMYLDGSLLGQFMTVRFFGYTNDGLPRFPVGIVLRSYEN